MDKRDFFRESGSVLNSDLSCFGLGVQYFHPTGGKIICHGNLRFRLLS